MDATPLVLVHGLWLHSDSWSRWLDFFHDHGYHAVAASWPGDAETTEATRRHPQAVANYGVTEIVDHVAGQFAAFDRKPVLIGHSFGGLVAQNLLGRGLAAGAIAICPAPIKGVREMPIAALRFALPILRSPHNVKRAVSLTEAQFRLGFGNAIPAAEARDLYSRYAMPAPARPLFQAATAMLNPWAATKVNLEYSNRGPLLLIAGSEDHATPPVWVRSTARLQQRDGSSTTLREFPGRGHSLVIDHGWRELAEYCVAWLHDHGFSAT